MNFSRTSNDSLMVVSGDFALFTPKAVLSPESIQILTRYMSENLSANVLEKQNVIFYGVHEINSSKEKLNCCFKFLDESKVQPGDIVAICPLGWKRLREIIYYVPSEIHFFDKWISMYSVVFEADNLPKDSAKYEFCYISSGNILGISKPFTFFSSSESDISIISEGDYIAVEDPHDPGLVVFKSRASKSTEDFSRDFDNETSGNCYDSSKACDDNQQQFLQNEKIDSFMSATFENLHIDVEKCEKQNKLQYQDTSNEMSAFEVKAMGTFETENNTSTNSAKMCCNETPKVCDDGQIQSIEELNNSSIKSFHSSMTSSLSTTPYIMDHPNDSEKECSLNSSIASLPELISNMSSSTQDAIQNSQETKNKISFGANEVQDNISDAQQAESVEQMNCAMGNSYTTYIDSSTQSGLPPDLIQKETTPSDSVTELSSKKDDKKPDHVSSSHSVTEVNNCVCSSYKTIANENKELQERVEELKETNAFLKSRVSVLELELRTLNEDKYGILLKCIESYENENSFLKEELDKRTKVECEIESLKFKCDRLTEENSELKFFTSCPSAFSVSGSKVLMLENNMLKAKCQQLEHKISDLNYAIQEEKAAQGLKSSRSIRQVILKQGHELAFMRSECREISEKLKTLIAMFESMNLKTEDYLAVTSSLSELQSKCAVVIQRNHEKTKLFEATTENREEKQKFLAQIKSLHKEICDVQKQNLELKEQLISLRKQSVGKVSLLHC